MRTALKISDEKYIASIEGAIRVALSFGIPLNDIIAYLIRAYHLKENDAIEMYNEIANKN